MKKQYFLILFVSMLTIIGTSSYFIINDSYAQEEENNICSQSTNNEIVKAYITDDNGITNFTETAHLSTTETGSHQYDVTLVLHYNNDSNKERKLDITLAEGLNWITWDDDTSNYIDKVEESNYNKINLNVIGDQTKSTYHTTSSGKKTFIFNSNHDCITLNFVISIDVPVYKKNIANAIVVNQYYDNQNINTKSLDVENNFDKIPIIHNYNYVQEIKELNGTTNENEKNYVSTGGRIAGIYNVQGAGIIYDNFEILIETPKGVKFLDGAPGGASYSNSAISKGWNCSYTGPEINNYDKCIYTGENGTTNEFYTFKYEKIKAVSIGLNPVWDFYGVTPTKIDNQESIDINLRKISYKLYGEEETHTEEFDNLINRYIINNNEDITLSSTTDVFGFNPKYPNDIIRLGSFNLKNNSAVTTTSKVVNIKFDSNKIGVTHVSLPAVLNQKITYLKYKMKTNEENWCNGNNKPDADGWCLFNKYALLSPNPMRTTYSNSLGYVNFINEMTGVDGYITEVEYIIGTIPGLATNTFPQGVFAYSGVLLKQNDISLKNAMSTIEYPSFYENKEECINNFCSRYTKIENDIYPINYISTITIKNEDGTNELKSNGNTKLYIDTNKKISVQNSISIYDSIKTKTKLLKEEEKLKLTYYITSATGGANYSSPLLKEPVIYIKLPKGITLNDDDITIEQSYYSPNIITEDDLKKYKLEEMKENYKFSNEEDYKISNVENTKSNGNYNIYKITFTDKYASYLGVGYPKYNLYAKESNRMFIKFSLNIDKSFNDNGEKHYYHDIIYVTDKSMLGLDNVRKITSKSDSIFVDDPTIIDETLNSMDPMVKEKEKVEYFQIKQEPDINANIKVKNNGEYTQLFDNEYYESERNKGTELEVTISNDSGVDNQKGTIFIPIPKAGEKLDGLLKPLNDDEEYTQFEYDLFLKDKIINPDKDKYTIYYGKNIDEIKYTDLLQKDIDWVNEDSISINELKEINLVKIEIKDIDKEEKVNFDFVLWNENVKNIEKSFDNFFIAYHRNLTDSNGKQYGGWKLTNYMSISISEMKKGKLIIKYVDENNEEIADNKIIEQYFGIEYIENPIKIEGYTYKTMEGIQTGIYQETDQFIKFIYEKQQTKEQETKPEGKVEVIYITEDDKPIKTEIITGTVGLSYEVIKNDPEEYEFVSISDNWKGLFTEDTIKVIIKYKKIEKEKELNNQDENRIKEYEKEEIEVPITSNYLSIIFAIISIIFISIGIIYIFLIIKYKIRIIK